MALTFSYLYMIRLVYIDKYSIYSTDPRAEAGAGKAALYMTDSWSTTRRLEGGL